MTAPIQEAVRRACDDNPMGRTIGPDGGFITTCLWPACECENITMDINYIATLIAQARAEGAAQERERAVQIARGRDFYPFGKPGAAYRAWCWEEPDASTSADSEITRHSDRIAAAIRARKEEPK